MNVRNSLLLMSTIGLLIAGWALLGNSQESKLPSLKIIDKGLSAPEFTKISAWVNSEPLKLADQKGKVVVIHFWTNGCINCIHNYPQYRAWQKKFADEKNYLMVGIHTPELDFEHDIGRIKAKAAENKLSFPIAVDNETATWNAWRNSVWPCVYLVDKEGYVRARWVGELGTQGFNEVTAGIELLLKEKDGK